MIIFDEENRSLFHSYYKETGQTIAASSILNSSSIEERLAAQQFQKERKAQLYSLYKYVPKKSGLYKINFPNNYFYVGAAKNLRQRIQQQLTELFPSKKKEQFSNWVLAARKIFPELTPFQIKIEFEFSSDYLSKLRQLKESLSKEEKSRSFNFLEELKILEKK